MDPDRLAALREHYDTTDQSAETAQVLAGIHTLIVTRDPYPDLPSMASITCPGVTPACAMWSPCEEPGCVSVTAPEQLPEEIWQITLHGVEHRWFDEEVSREFWAVETDRCYAEETGDAPAEEFADDKNLPSGQYPVTVEINGPTVLFSLATGTPDRSCYNAAD